MIGEEQQKVVNKYLMEAVNNGDKAGIDLALQKGADINNVDSNDYTPLMRAVYNENIPIVEYLLTKNPDLMVKAQRGSVFDLHDKMGWNDSSKKIPIKKKLIAALPDRDAPTPAPDARAEAAAVRPIEFKNAAKKDNGGKRLTF